MSVADKMIRTSAPAAVFLVRLIVGPIFLSEGIQKFLYPDENGVGRFAKIGIPWPEFTGPFVGVVEIVCGTLILIGLLTRLDQDSDPSGLWILGVQPKERSILRLLGDGPRDADRLGNAAWFDIFVDRRRRRLVARSLLE